MRIVGLWPSVLSRQIHLAELGVEAVDAIAPLVGSSAPAPDYAGVATHTVALLAIEAVAIDNHIGRVLVNVESDPEKVQEVTDHYFYLGKATSVLKII